jgi:hypothetical protein
MTKPLDYYAGYPNQQRMPKWVGVTLGSLFGGLTIFALAVGIRMVMPARSAEASMAPKPTPAETPVVAPAAEAAVTAPAAAPVPAPSALVPNNARHRGSHVRAMKAPRNPIADARYKKAQVFAKHVSGSNHRDKKARDELDKLLGM